MTDPELIQLANQHGLEQCIARDEDNGLANPQGLAEELFRADLITYTELLEVITR